MAARGPNPARGALKMARGRALIKEEYRPNGTRHDDLSKP